MVIEKVYGKDTKFVPFTEAGLSSNRSFKPFVAVVYAAKKQAYNQFIGKWFVDGLARS